MITGDIRKINLSTASFERMTNGGSLYVDKSRFIENFLGQSSDVQLITRQRRLGKSLNMDMLRRFLTDKEDNRHLFKDLYIENSPAWSHANSAPVLHFDFKLLQAESYKKEIFLMIRDHIDEHCGDATLSWAARSYIADGDPGNTNGLLHLSESVYRATGKRSYVLIDEYDKLLMENYNSENYDAIMIFMTALFSAALKGNRYLEKAMMTGVMWISHESMFSGLNNIVTFDVFKDDVYTDEYGLTEEETKALNKMLDFNIDEARAWYNGVRINGKPIYNIYSLLSYLSHGEYSCYWGKSGTMDMVADLLNDERRATLVKLLNGERVTVPIVNRISLRDLLGKSSDHGFYSLLVQAGYLALCTAVSGKDSFASVSIPNIELQIVWKQFILEKLYPNTPRIRTLFDNVDNLDVFSNLSTFYATGFHITIWL
jgi:hypothetical protein